ncbi:MAG: 50S ribosomal protein L22 [Candidatus Marinimicrobia bacterium]|nr:50S ribosomal protein L22 [Candidatus Neomarinimicrobiota bacterium]
MEVKAVTKYVRLAPSKARDLARSIQGLGAEAALNLTQHSRRKAAVQLGKTLKSALANAEHNAELAPENMYVKEAVIEPGPTLKRFWPRSRGMVSPIKRRSCHIRVILAERAERSR